MKKGIRKILAAMLSAAMVVSVFPSSVTAAPENAETAGATQEEQTEAAAEPAEESVQPEETAETAAQDSEEAEQPEASAEEQAVEAQAVQESLQARSIDWEALKEYIRKAIFQDYESTAVNLSEFSLQEEEAATVTDEVLTESNATTLVDTEFVENEEGQVETMTISMDPELKAVAQELDELSDGEGEEGSQEGPIPMTDEQKQQVLDAYAAYQEYVAANPDYFGIQTPFFANKETNDTDWGPLGSLMVIAGMTEDKIESGEVTFEMLYGTVQMFHQGNQAAVENMGSQLLAVKDQALSHLDDSMSTVEKLLVLNDWLADWSTFDMAYIMNMAAPEPADTGIDPNIQGLWEGNQFGPLCLKKGVCLGYSNAYTYLVQWAFPEIYKNADGSWKTKEELNYVTKSEQAVDENGNPAVDENGNAVMVDVQEWSPDAAYMVDYVRITYDATVTMFGEPQENFGSDHYWNAVKVDGEWYYVDPCYTDIYIECMIRERVETDGNMNHMYFMVSDPTVRQLYDGYYKSLDTLYQDIATDQTYQQSWIAFAKSPVDEVDNKYYYFYDSTDLISLMGQYGGMGGNTSTQASSRAGYEDLMGDSDYQLVYRDGDSADSANEFTTLVNFVDGTVLNPSNGEMEENSLIKELYEEHLDYQEKFPSVAISGSVYNGVFYFNISNCILSYDLSTGEVAKVMEYNKVSAHRDLSVALGGMGFSVVPDDSEDVDLTVYNNPIASMTIKDDGNMYVSVATNYGWISGKTSMEDTENLGYAYQETNYNPGYNSYFNYNDEINDNDEFMWSANFVDTIAMSHLTGSEHTYEDVTVAPSCGREGFTESRCTECGMIEPGTERTDIKEALGHHYVQMEDQHYTKDEDGNFNTETVYICAGCLDAKSELDEGEVAGEHTYGEPTFTWSEDHSACTAEFSCAVCSTQNLDCLQGVENPVQTVECEVTSDNEGFDCAAGGTITYTATCEFNGKEYTTEEAVEIPAGEHVYGEPTFTWADDYSTCKITFECANCGTTVEEDCTVTSETTEATCTEDGKNIYTATYTIGETTYTDTKEEAIPAKGHDYVYTDNGDGTHTVTCNNCDLNEVENCEYEDYTCTKCGAVNNDAVAPVEGLTATSAGKQKVRISWQASEGADGYLICRKQNDVYDGVIGYVVGEDVTSYTDKEALDTDYSFYWVFPYVQDSEGNVIEGRCPKYVYGMGVTAPVKNLKATSVNDGVLLSWTMSNDAEGYLVYGIKNGGSYSYIGMVNDGRTQFKDKGASSTEWSFYWVFPYHTNDDGKMIPGRCPQYVYGRAASTSITDFKATSVEGGVELTWNDTSDADGYLIYGRRAGGAYESIGMTTTGMKYTDTEASATEYNYYWVYPYKTDSNGNVTVGVGSDYVYAMAK